MVVVMMVKVVKMVKENGGGDDGDVDGNGR